MTDVFHQWGSDLVMGPTGDLATAVPPVVGQQRVLRRLLSNPGDYIWQLAYGAGLARFVGRPTSALQIRACVRSQISKEAVVALSPEPVIDVIDPSGAAPTSGIYLNVRYADQQNGQTQFLSVAVSA